MNLLVRCGASYADLFVPPFEPWSAAAVAGTRMSASGRLLGDDHDETTEEDRHLASSESEKAVMQGEEHENFSSMPGEMWGGVPDYLSITERRRCFLDLTQKGAT